LIFPFKVIAVEDSITTSSPLGKICLEVKRGYPYTSCFWRCLNLQERSLNIVFLLTSRQSSETEIVISFSLTLKYATVAE